jgi:uncharacterized glyoxalase superfamily protein PhnB
MMRNRSVPTNVLLSHVTYRDLPEAIRWLGNTFGFVEHFRYGDPVAGSQLHLGDAWIMARAAKPEYRTPAELGFGTQSLTVFVEELEKHYERTKAAGAKIVEELHETEYGELQYAALDLDGHHWLFARHARDMNPDAWGATIIHPLDNAR